jgi:hypothetical protein
MNEWYIRSVERRVERLEEDKIGCLPVIGGCLLALGGIGVLLSLLGLVIVLFSSGG